MKNRPATVNKGVNRSSRALRAVDTQSEGQRLLVALGLSLEDVAGAVGCSRQAVSKWRSGEQTPSEVMRGKLFTAFGVPASAWGARPGAAPTLPEEPPPRAATPSTLDAALDLHAVIRRARCATNLTTAETVRLADSEARLLALRYRLEQDALLSESRIVRDHPSWQALRRTLSKVVAGCPRCSKLLLAELARLDM